MGARSSSIRAPQVLVLGLENVGKTTLSRYIQDRRFTTTVPTVGTDEIQTRLADLYDMGGHSELRKLWIHNFAGTDLMLFVVDGSDTEHTEVASKQLQEVLRHPDMAHVKFLLVVNKIDKAGVQQDEAHYLKEYSLDDEDRCDGVRFVCSVDGQGVQGIREWIEANRRR